MPINGILYENNRPEVHRIAGFPQSFINRNSLFFFTPTGAQAAHLYMAANTDVVLRIMPRFKDTQGVPGKHSDGRVEIDLATGEVIVLGASPASARPNFII